MDQLGYIGTKHSGKTTSSAPLSAASAVASQMRSTVALLSKGRTGAIWTAAALSCLSLLSKLILSPGSNDYALMVSPTQEPSGIMAMGLTGEPVAPTSFSGVHTKVKRYSAADASSSSRRFSTM